MKENLGKEQLMLQCNGLEKSSSMLLLDNYMWVEIEMRFNDSFN